MEPLSFKLRGLTADDAESIARHANNINVSKNLRDRFPYPYTAKDALEFIETFIPSFTGKVFGIDVDGEAVGTIGFHLQQDEYRFNAELGYWLGEEFWNRGIMTSAVRSVVSFAFENYEINKIFAKVYDYNKVSSIVLVKNGFKLEARLVNNVIKFGKLTDELIYVKFREEGIK